MEDSQERCLVYGSNYSMIKRAMDVVISLLGLIVCAPLMAIIAIAIKVTSRGPVIYRQERPGFLGTPFTIYKFRTMPLGSDKLGETTRPNDPRINWLGRLLRPRHLDELPQLFNVLKGDMSLIGPRPQSYGHCLEYIEAAPLFPHRYKWQPGLTGIAQLGKIPGNTTEGLRHNFTLGIQYSPSIGADLKILFRTVFVILRGKRV